jgi:death on curing protein
MAGTEQALTVAEIAEINRRMIESFGGFFAGKDNLSNPGSLEHVLAATQGSLFGQELYPTLIEKAAAIGWRIIVGHVFHDGNKRTGMEACRLFLDLNGHDMRIDHQVIDMALALAKGEASFADFAAWVEARTTARSSQDAGHQPPASA